jgi:hypothetical protein
MFHISPALGISCCRFGDDDLRVGSKILNVVWAEYVHYFGDHGLILTGTRMIIIVTDFVITSFNRHGAIAWVEEKMDFGIEEKPPVC